MTISKRARIGGGGGGDEGDSFVRSALSKSSSSSSSSSSKGKGGGRSSGSGGGGSSSGGWGSSSSGRSFSSLKRDRGWDDNDDNDDYDNDDDYGFGQFESGSEGEYHPTPKAFRRTTSANQNSQQKKVNPWSTKTSSTTTKTATPPKAANKNTAKIIPMDEEDVEEEIESSKRLKRKREDSPSSSSGSGSDTVIFRRDDRNSSVVNSMLESGEEGEDEDEDAENGGENLRDENDDDDEENTTATKSSNNKKKGSKEVVVKKRNGRPSTKGMSSLLDEEEMESYKGNRSVVVESGELMDQNSSCVPDHLNDEFLDRVLGKFSGPRCPACKSIKMSNPRILNYKDEIKKLLSEFLSDIDSICPFEHCIYFAEEYNDNVIIPYNKETKDMIDNIGIDKQFLTPVTPRDIFRHFTKCKIIPQFQYKLHYLASIRKSEALLKDSQAMVVNKEGETRMVSDFNLSKVWVASMNMVDKLLSKKLHPDSIFVQNQLNDDKLVTFSMKGAVIPIAGLKLAIPRMLPSITQIEEIN